MTVWFTPRWRLQTGPSQLSVHYKYTTTEPGALEWCHIRYVMTIHAT
jgi:hypothetical protein